MKMIKELSDRIKEELEGVEDYAALASRYRGLNDTLSALYGEIAAQEMTHVDKLHGKAMEIIAAWRKDHGEPPRQMAMLWEHEHKRMIQRMAAAKMMMQK